MARAISADALAIIASGADYKSRLTIAHPTVEVDPRPVEVAVNIGKDWSVTERSVVAGQRLTVSGLQLLPTDGIDDLFAFAGYPGAVYRLSIGIGEGAEIEWVTVFTGYVVEGSSRRNRLGVAVSLADGWSWSDRVPLVDPFVTVAQVARATTIVDLMTPPAVGFGTEIEDVGGYITIPGVYTDSRGQAAAAIAEDGLVQAGFNNEGDLVIKAQPDLSMGTLTPDWLFRSGQSVSLAVPPPPAFPATIVAGTLERTRPWADSLYNAVVVKPARSEQTWTAQMVTMSNTADPRHPDKVGLRPYEITSSTIDNACDAWNLAGATMARLLRGTDETVKLTVLLNPAVEADDVFSPSALPTLDDPGWSGLYIATSVTHSKSAATTSIEGVSARGYAFA